LGLLIRAQEDNILHGIWIVRGAPCINNLIFCGW